MKPPSRMRNTKTKKLALSSTTVRALSDTELTAAAGGYAKTAYVCTGKNSNCHKCDIQF